MTQSSSSVMIIAVYVWICLLLVLTLLFFMLGKEHFPSGDERKNYRQESLEETCFCCLEWIVNHLRLIQGGFIFTENYFIFNLFPHLSLSCNCLLLFVPSAQIVSENYFELKQLSFQFPHKFVLFHIVLYALYQHHPSAVCVKERYPVTICEDNLNHCLEYHLTERQTRLSQMEGWQ